MSSYLTDPTLKPSTRKVNDTTYDTVFQTMDHHALILRVHIPPSAGMVSAPKMTLVGIRASHSWIDSRMKVVGYAPIQSDEAFVNSGMLLAQVVNTVVQHFQLHPPHCLIIVDESLKTLQASIVKNNNAAAATAASASASGGPSNPMSSATNHYAPPPPTKAPSSSFGFGFQKQEPPPPPPTPQVNLPTHFSDVVQIIDDDRKKRNIMLSQISQGETPRTFPEFREMSLVQMTSHLDNNESLKPILQKQTILQQTQTIQQKILEANAKTAQRLLDESEETLNRSLTEILDLKSSLKAKVEHVNKLQMKQMELCKPMDKNDILWKLKKAKRTSMDESETLAHDWLESSHDGGGGGKAMDEFLDGFLKERTIHHVRAAKIERIEHSN